MRDLSGLCKATTWKYPWRQSVLPSRQRCTEVPESWIEAALHQAVSKSNIYQRIKVTSIEQGDEKKNWGMIMGYFDHVNAQKHLIQWCAWVKSDEISDARHKDFVTVVVDIERKRWVAGSD